MIYIKAASSYSSKVRVDTKELLKSIGGKAFRRTDRFTQLALIGAHKLFQSSEIDPKSVLYLASSDASLALFNTIRDQKFIYNQPPRPVDFINMLSGSAAFYVAKYLNLSAKCISLTHYSFPAQMALILASTELESKRASSVVLGGVDELMEPEELYQKLAGINKSIKLFEGSNYLLLSTNKADAVGSIHTYAKIQTFDDVAELLRCIGGNTKVAFGVCVDQETRELLCAKTTAELFEYDCGFYATSPLFVVSEFLDRSCGTLLFIDGLNDEFMSIEVRSFSGE